MRKQKEINWRVGSNIQLARENARYTQEQLAEKLGITPNHLSAVERGVAGASLELLERICLTLNVSADFLFFGPGQQDETLLRLSQRLLRASPEHLGQIKLILSSLANILAEVDHTEA